MLSEGPGRCRFPFLNPVKATLLKTIHHNHHHCYCHQIAIIMIMIIIMNIIKIIIMSIIMITMGLIGVCDVSEGGQERHLHPTFP